MARQITLDFPAIQTRHTEAEIGLIADAIRDARTLSMGPYLKEFEDNFAAYLGTRYAFAVSNCTSALELAAMLSGVGEGDEVILPAHTFTSTALPFLRRKAKLVFCDIDPATLVLEPDDVEAKLTARTKVIVPVHLYGLPAPMDRVMELAQRHGLLVVEDCAQAPGAEFRGRKVGTFGQLGCFSFHGQKNITSLGEGGMIVTSDERLAEQILGLRKIGARPYLNQEKYWKPAMSNIVEALPGELPYNFALGEIAAFAGNLILKRVDAINAARREARDAIVEALKDYPELTFQQFPPETLSACHLLPARFEGGATGRHRDDLMEELLAQGVKCVVQYCPLYRYELFRNNGYTQASCPNSDDFFDNMISFPFGSELTRTEVAFLIEAIKKAITTLRG